MVQAVVNSLREIEIRVGSMICDGDTRLMSTRDRAYREDLAEMRRDEICSWLKYKFVNRVIIQAEYEKRMRIVSRADFTTLDETLRVKQMVGMGTSEHKREDSPKEPS